MQCGLESKNFVYCEQKHQACERCIENMAGCAIRYGSKNVYCCDPNCKMIYDDDTLKKAIPNFVFQKLHTHVAMLPSISYEADLEEEDENQILLSDVFHSNANGNFTITYTNSIRRCSFGVGTEHSYRTVFLDTNIPDFSGCYRWTVQIIYGEKKSAFYFGTAPSNSLSKCDENFLGSVGGTCSFKFMKDEEVLRSMFTGVENHEDSVDKVLVWNRSVVSMEIDALSRMLSFFVDGVKIPMKISDVHMPLHFGMSGLGNGAFTTLSFIQLPTATSSSGFKLYKCADGNSNK